MGRFLIQRGLESLIVLIVLSFAIYGLMGLMPGDPIDVMVSADPTLTPADAERLKALYGLDRPLVERYLAWAGAALSGDFGYSRLYGVPSMEALLPRLSATLILLGASLALTLAIAVPLGAAAALKPRSAFDYGVNLICFAGISVPPFWLAILMILAFAVTVDWLPAGGVAAPDAPWHRHLAHAVLPVATLTLLSVGGFIRFMRASMMETLRQDYVRTARAKGLSQGQVARRHALRNALLPVVTILGLSFGTLFSGALITETVFAWPGMGKLIYDAILGSDYNLAMLGLMLATLTTLVGNLLADIAYAGIDPRVSVGAEERVR